MKTSLNMARAWILLPGLTAVMVLTACGSLGSRDGHADSRETRALEVPPDLVAPNVDPSFRIPEQTTARASALEDRRAVPGEISSGTQARVPVLVDASTLQLRREGNVRWLEVEDTPPADLWPQLRAFFQAQSLPLNREEPALGILETEWFQARAQVPMEGGIRGLLGRLFGDFYDASTRDQYRVRLEPQGDSGTAVFVSHRSVEEVAEREDIVRWRMRPSDPEAEAEMLVRLMVHLGLEPEQAAQALGQAPDLTPGLRLSEANGETALEVRGEFTGLWRRMGVLLDRAALLVDDQDRSEGVYYVTFRPEAHERRGGFFSRLFSTGESARLRPDTQYQIHLRQAGDWVQVIPRSQAGEALSGGEAAAVLERIEQELNPGGNQG
ncbi:outer membrane protein assembly factor BamC [Ectothiorhodospira shaposhnikovii]|uniref:outer membrane protein assembly factor BamC n=1 Tax=Ectothiorhodospira shaposhnikovii TaxID=1054 RepID=UPI0039A0E96F